MPELNAWLARFHPTSYLGVLKCCLVGVVVTSILQSSSVTVGLTQVLASQGILDFETSVALVLGHNIGTTITAYLASFGTSRNAKRAAYAHVLIKVIGVACFVPLFFQYIRILRLVLVHFDLVPEVSVMVNGVEEFQNAMKGIALAHTVFNVINVAVLIWFVDYIAKAVRFLAPDKAQKEVPHLTFLDLRMMDAPAIGIQQSMNEILRMSDDVKKMIVWLRESLVDQSRDLKREQHLFHREEVMDVLQKEVVEFLSHLLSGIVPYEVMNRGRQQLRMADEYESISDYVITILKLNIKIRKENLTMSEEGRREVLDLHDRVAEYVEMITEAVREERVEILTKANARGAEIVRLMKEYRSHHLARVGTENMSPLMSLYYADMLNSYRRIRDHALNIAEVVAGEK
jgi:phosphate:Na+ symporter